MDDEFNEFAIEQINTVDTLLFGRVTYELMAGYWPTPAAKTDDPVIAEIMNTTPKIVFSKTLTSVDWQNTRLIKDNFLEEMLKLKQQPGQDVLVAGSGTLVQTLIEHNLVDEYHLLIYPVVLGSGKRLFQDGSNATLKLVESKTFNSGVIAQIYQPDRK